MRVVWESASESESESESEKGAGAMRVEFVVRDGMPERLVCEAELCFEEGELDGMKLVGFSLWRSPDGEVYVTFPSRAFGLGAERRFFDYLRASEGDAKTVRRVKGWMVEEFRKRSAAAPTTA